jgi:hypothetical protein
MAINKYHFAIGAKNQLAKAKDQFVKTKNQVARANIQKILKIVLHIVFWLKVQLRSWYHLLDILIR